MLYEKEEVDFNHATIKRTIIMYKKFKLILGT